MGEVQAKVRLRDCRAQVFGKELGFGARQREALAGDSQVDVVGHGCTRGWVAGIWAAIQASTSDSSQTVTRGESGMDLGNRPRSISQYRWDREMPVRLSTSGLRKKRSLRPASGRGALAGAPGGAAGVVREASIV